MSSKSFLGKNWKIQNNDKSLSILERLLHNRGLKDKDKITEFINPDFKHMHDPFLMDNMQTAVDRIKAAIKADERILIFGDYDVDGITATAILYLLLTDLGANVSCRLPSRSADGYGLSEKYIREAADVDVKLLITTDCGISCAKEVRLGKELGLETIITDHHTIPDEIPEEAVAILHPKLPKSGYPFSDLTGAGVAYKLADALVKDIIPLAKQEETIRQYLDLATLGTIADLGPLVGENRTIVKSGLEQIKNTKWEGLAALQEVCGIKEDETVHTNHVSFRMAPRLNAAGRIESPYTALKLFFKKGDEAKAIAEKLEQINRKRQRLTEEAIKEAESIVDEQLEKNNILIAMHPNWTSGLIGIIAGKLAGKYGMPTIIMEDRGEVYVGSARGPEFYDLVEALKSVEKYLVDFGGHVQAAGFTLPKENLEVFKHAMQAHARDHFGQDHEKAILKIDTEINQSDINNNLIAQLDTIRPFGMKNDRPMFLIKGVYLQDMRRVGHDRKHLLGKAKLDTDLYKFIAFNFGPLAKEIPEFTRVDIICHLDKNTYRGVTKIELQVVDMRLSGQ